MQTHRFNNENGHVHKCHAILYLTPLSSPPPPITNVTLRCHPYSNVTHKPFALSIRCFAVFLFFQHFFGVRTQCRVINNKC